MPTELARRHAAELDRHNRNDNKGPKEQPRPPAIVVEGRFGRLPLPPQPSPHSDRDAAVAELADWLGAHA